MPLPLPLPLPLPQRLPLPAVPEDERVFLADPALPDGRFHNPWGARSDKRLGDLLRWKLQETNPFAAEKRRPPALPVAPDPRGRFDGLPPGARLQWLGHASVLVELDGRILLIDPVFGRAGPGVERLVPAPRSPEDLPRVDAVLLTHGHYDHLDRASIAAVLARSPEALVVVPRGQEASLPSACRRVVCLDWWEAVALEPVQVVLVPAQHWHRRGLFDQDRALWGGFFLRGSRSLYHAGDTGYFGGFRTIGRVLGAPDVAVLPLGAYEPRWFMAPQHMSPEDSLQAFVDLGARNLVGMHWGTFDLTDEPADHGPFTLLPAVAAERGLPGERLHVLAHGGVLDFRDPAAADPAGTRAAG